MASKRLARRLAESVVEVRKAEEALRLQAGLHPAFNIPDPEVIYSKARLLSWQEVRECLRVNQIVLAAMREHRSFMAGTNRSSADDAVTEVQRILG